MGNQFFGGIPTEPDVKKLLDRFGNPGPGLIPHSEIEAVLQHERHTSRYRAVVTAWRRRLLREAWLGTKAVPGEGIKILTEPEKVDEQGRLQRLGARQVIKLHRWNLMVDVSKLDEVSRAKHDHQVRYSSTMASTAAEGMRVLIAALKAPEQLPRPKR